MTERELDALLREFVKAPVPMGLERRVIARAHRRRWWRVVAAGAIAAMVLATVSVYRSLSVPVVLPPVVGADIRADIQPPVRGQPVSGPQPLIARQHVRKKRVGAPPTPMQLWPLTEDVKGLIAFVESHPERASAMAADGALTWKEDVQNEDSDHRVPDGSDGTSPDNHDEPDPA